MPIILAGITVILVGTPDSIPARSINLLDNNHNRYLKICLQFNYQNTL